MGNICGHYITENGFCKVAKQLCEKVALKSYASIQDLTDYAKIGEAKR
jgi:hypothetical protein